MQDDLPLFKTTNATKTQIELGVKPENESIFSVSEVSNWVKRTIEINFSKLHIKGEISQPKYHASGHLYCRIKDANAVIEAVAWRGVASRLPFKLEDGMEVIATGKLTTYQGRSQYQLIIESIELAGEGALLKLIEERKKRLAAEGLFDPQYKKPLPYLPQAIGVITSETGAVIRDILHRIQDRFPLPVLLWPTAVQGEKAASQIIEAIQGFNQCTDPALRPDLIIIARGGGSLEDLMPFQDESLIRAAFKSEIPIISAVGHETDTTLIDFVSDKRAPTPTAAAEMAVPVREELLLLSRNYYQRMRVQMYRYLVERKRIIAQLAASIHDPAMLLANLNQRADDWSSRFTNAWSNFLEKKRQKFQLLTQAFSPIFMLQKLKALYEQLRFTSSNFQKSAQLYHTQKHQQLTFLKSLLESYSYQNTLKRGYSLVKNNDGKIITSSQKATTEKSMELIFYDGSIQIRPNKQ